MFCRECGTEYKDSFCPNCGTAMMQSGSKSKRKWEPFLIAGSIFIILLLLWSCTSSDSENTESQDATSMQSQSESQYDFEFISEVTAEENMLGWVDLYGVVKNTTGQDLSYASITFNLYDYDGNQIGTASDFITNWEEGTSWRFEAASMTEAYLVANYKLVELSGY